jgi:general secretion pathway protein M
MKAWLDRLRATWAGLAERDRRVLMVGAGALALILVYVAGWQPLTSARERRAAALAEARSLAVKLETLAAETTRRRGTGGATIAGTNQSLLAVVDATRKTAGLTKQPSIQPEGESTVRIQIEDVPFDQLVRWLNDLQTRYGVRVDSADIDRVSGAGLVNARLTLMRS